MTVKTPSKTVKPKSIKRSFHQELVLNRWMMGFFKGGTLEALKQRLGDDRHEGIDEDGQSLFCKELTGSHLFEVDRVSNADLIRYDINIVKHWQQITEHRNKKEGVTLQMKYFQYLSLLFTEIYLDWYFNKRQALLDGLNEQMQAYRSEIGAEPFQNYIADDLNKIAFWNATGSGKTLLLHVNILQYLHYFQNGKAGSYPDKIILLTPNEGLSRQHLEELALSGFSLPQLFNKTQSPTRGTVEIIDINKLGDEMGDKTVAVDAFEGNNLVLVDEGHRGTGTAAGAWMSRRDALVRGGFAFEYSATFGQAVAKGMIVSAVEEDIQKKRAKTLFETVALKKLDANQLKKLALTTEDQRKARITATREIYAKCILFDYSYKFFYADGYGKESLILNMDGKAYEVKNNPEKYFTACLLSFYQQQWLWDTNKEKITDFNIEHPLWVFVGNTVSGEDSDILEVVNFLAYVLNHDGQIKAWLADLINDRAQLLDAKGNNIFQGRFTALMGFAADVDRLYADILKRVFNAPAKQRLKLVNIKNTKGELALRVGGAEPFGLINIGDDAGFFKLADEATAFDNESDAFGEQLFDKINQKDSKLNILVGSRKFTEGWSSWRVSTMGLLNMGQGEGSQIIQLFGRGVRLKGKGYSLKRTKHQQRPKGVHLEKLETLNIFGVRASYMATFKEYLKEEGVTTSDEMLQLDFETQPNLPTGKLKTLALKDGYKDNQKLGFKRKEFPWLYEFPREIEDKVKKPHVVLDLYPRIEALSTQAKVVSTTEARHSGKLNTAIFSLFDFDRIYLELQNYKMQRSWSNLRLDRQMLIDFCQADNSWYTLYLPADELKIDNFDAVKRQEDILIRLLTDYTDRFYKTLKNAYEGQFYCVVDVRDDSAPITMGLHYHFEIEDTADGNVYFSRLNTLAELVKKKNIGEINKHALNHMVAICFEPHLYYPLMHLVDKDALPLKMRPLAFDAPSEVQFVRDLEAFYQSPVGKAAIGERSLYLLRNADSKNKGLGFALAGNFYPDFLLWLVDDASGEQWLTFIDPKGLRQMDLNDPKLGLYREVKNLQATLEKQAKPEDTRLILNAFILSPTKYADLLNTVEKREELERRHVLFMEDGGSTYLEKMLERMV